MAGGADGIGVSEPGSPGESADFSGAGCGEGVGVAEEGAVGGHEAVKGGVSGVV